MAKVKSNRPLTSWSNNPEAGRASRVLACDTAARKRLYQIPVEFGRDVPRSFGRCKLTREKGLSFVSILLRALFRASWILPLCLELDFQGWRQGRFSHISFAVACA